MLNQTLQRETPQVSQSNLPSGLNGNKKTVKIMSKAARENAAFPIVRECAIHILNQYNVSSMNYKDECLAIGNWVQKNVTYVRDPDGIELLTDPKTMIDKISRGVARGDCDDMALLIATLLLSIGHRPFFRCVRYKSNYGHYNHIYVVCYEKNRSNSPERIVLDAIIKWQPIGYEVPHQSGDEYPA